MTAITKAWVTIADGAVDPDSPLDAALMTGLRDDLVHLREWLGASYTAGAVQNHNHDGANSAAIETGVAVRNGGFEDGTNGWTLTAFTGGTIATNTGNEQEGAACLGITSTVLANGGGEAIMAGFTTVAQALRPMTFTLAVKASAANISSKAEVLWYNDTQASISTSTIYTSTNTPTTAAIQEVLLTPPATAKYFKIKLTGGVPSSGSGTGTVYFDAVSAAVGVTYIGSLVESSAVQMGSSRFSMNSATLDLGSGRVVTGIRTVASDDDNSGCCNPTTAGSLYIRGYNLKSN